MKLTTNRCLGFIFFILLLVHMIQLVLYLYVPNPFVAISIGDDAGFHRYCRVFKLELNERDYGYDRNTLLHLATMRGNLAIMEELLKMGADVNAHNFYDGTPLGYALNRKNGRAIALLKRYGAVEKSR